MTVPRILIIAGSDSGGGAGIQADIKTVTMLRGHAMTAITALTAQNTLGVQAIHPVPADFVAEQMNSVIEDIGVDAVKIGMLGSSEIVAIVAGMLLAAPQVAARSAAGWAKSAKPPGVRRVPIVVDPVMVAKGGDRLASAEVIVAMKARLLPLATLITPNSPELEVLTGMPVRDAAQAEAAALMLMEMTGAAVLAKGAHLPGDRIVDLLVEADGQLSRWDSARITSGHTHGTGCTLASGIATGLGAGLQICDAITQARGYVQATIMAAPGLGLGNGPLGHGLVRAMQD